MLQEKNSTKYLSGFLHTVALFNLLSFFFVGPLSISFLPLFLTSFPPQMPSMHMKITQSLLETEKKKKSGYPQRMLAFKMARIQPCSSWVENKSCYAKQSVDAGGMVCSASQTACTAGNDFSS